MYYSHRIRCLAPIHFAGCRWRWRSQSIESGHKDQRIRGYLEKEVSSAKMNDPSDRGTDSLCKWQKYSGKTETVRRCCVRDLNDREDSIPMTKQGCPGVILLVVLVLDVSTGAAKAQPTVTKSKA